MKTDVEIAQEAQMRPIQEIAEKLGISADELELYGKYKAKVALSAWERVKEQPNGKLILVTAINPTPAGEGKTTTSVGLADAFHRQGKKVAVALREPSLGPCFGLKGGAVVGNPIPEEYAMDPVEMNKVIDRAVEMANEQGIHGKATTPFLLAHIVEMTGGHSLDSNIQLAFNNAHAASKIAVAYSKM